MQNILRTVLSKTATIGTLGMMLLHSCFLPKYSHHFSERTVDLTFRFTILDLPENTGHIAVWVPVPVSNTAQTLIEFHVEGNQSYRLLSEPEYDNLFIHFEPTIPATKENIYMAVTFRVKRKAYQVFQMNAMDDSPSQVTLARFLSPDSLVPIDGEIAKEAFRIAGKIESPLGRARRLYDHIVGSVRYDKNGMGWGRGDALYVCDIRTGNCTDFHSLFIGEARALGIPARFIMGLPLPSDKSKGTILGYHCWAEFYLEGKGWIPLDASEAYKFPDRKEALWGGLDQNRIQFTVGRDIQLPFSATGALNYSIYPHVEIDGKVHSKVETKFTFSDVL